MFPRSRGPLPGQLPAFVDELPPRADEPRMPTGAAQGYHAWAARILPTVLAWARRFEAHPDVEARRRGWQIAEVAIAERLPEPPDIDHQWGQFTRDLHSVNLLIPVGFAPSVRPGTKGSLVHTWRLARVVGNGGPA